MSKGVDRALYVEKRRTPREREVQGIVVHFVHERATIKRVDGTVRSAAQIAFLFLPSVATLLAYLIFATHEPRDLLWRGSCSFVVTFKERLDGPCSSLALRKIGN